MGTNSSRLTTDFEYPDVVPLQLAPISIRDLIHANPALRPEVVDGVLRRGETANIIASPKVGKSFLVGNLAWCIADGRPWLSHSVKKGKVLIIDNELHPETLADRLDCIAREMQIDAASSDAIDVVCMRGKNIDIHDLETRLAAIKPGTYILAIVDALYRTLPVGTSENDNAAMMAIYNRLDYYAASWDAAIAVVHHSSKGSQGDKAIADVGAGAGSISRAADAHLVIRPHKQPELCVLECLTRSFKSPEPVSISFDWPIWSAVTTAAEVKRVGRQNQEQQAKLDMESLAALLDRIPVEPSKVQQSILFSQVDGGENKLRRLVKKLVIDGSIREVRGRKKGAKRTLIFYNKPKQAPEVTPQISTGV